LVLSECVVEPPWVGDSLPGSDELDHLLSFGYVDCPGLVFVVTLWDWELTCSNEAQHGAYQKCFLEYYYCATVWGELSDIPARSAGPYIHVGQA
jgi:hypothetical protein